jgi:hypothetical protein
MIHDRIVAKKVCKNVTGKYISWMHLSAQPSANSPPKRQPISYRDLPFKETYQNLFVGESGAGLCRQVWQSIRRAKSPEPIQVGNG